MTTGKENLSNKKRYTIVESINATKWHQAWHCVLSGKKVKQNKHCTLWHTGMSVRTLFFFIIILALHQQHSVYYDSGFRTFFFWPRVLKFLQDGSTYFRWSEKVFVQLPQTTIMSRHITFYCLQWPHLLPISQSALFCLLHQSFLPPSRGLKTNCQFQTVCVKSTQRNKLKHEL